MKRARILTLLGISTGICGIAFGIGAYRDAEANEAIHQAEVLLNLPFEEGPELHDLPVEEIAALLERARELGAEPPHGLAQEVAALEYWAAGDQIFAEGALNEAQQSDGWTPLRRVLAAAIARSKADIPVAWNHVREASGLDPEDQRALLMTADLALDREDVRAATTAIRRLVISHPRVAVVQNRLGLVLELAGDPLGAVNAFEHAVDLDDNLHVAWINLGRRRRSGGELELAREAFERATTLQPGEGDAWLGLGLIHLDLGDIEASELALERAEELMPHEATPQLGLGDLFAATGENLAAIQAYREALRRRDDQPGSWLKLGNVLTREGELQSAEEAFRQALHHDPELAAAHNGLGSVLSQRGQTDSATEALRRAAELDDADPNPLMNLALLHESQGAFDQARAAWQAALDRDPSALIAAERLARLGS
ncbi:MAG: tetratricopeptide (TPR) repeat protein [Polyangiales bacterium]|jgi:tetratricopeptide (TPR) repeat protein